MSEIASFEDLTSGVEQFATVPLAGGKTVRVRGLSRYEYMLVAKQARNGDEMDMGTFEVLTVHYGLVEPQLSRGQVERWQKSPGSGPDFGAVQDKIQELSGNRSGADKSDLPSVRDES